jgi:hypothetical protein
MEQEYYIADMRPEWRGNPYITFWRPKNAGYAYPLSWAGRYSAASVADGSGYYTTRTGRSLIRFAVLAEVADRIAIDPGPGMIEGNAGPVVINSVENRRRLRRTAFLPQST